MEKQELVLYCVFPVRPLMFPRSHNIIMRDLQGFHFGMQGIVHIEEEITGAAVDDDGE